jgi:hypothetical protein
VRGDSPRADRGPQPQKQHPPFVVAPQRLEAGVVDDPHRLAEGRGKIEADPARAEILRVVHDAAAAHAAGQPEGDRLIRPVLNRLLGLPNHRFRRERLARLEFQVLLMARVPELHRAAADVDDEDFHRSFRHKLPFDPPFKS